MSRIGRPLGVLLGLCMTLTTPAAALGDCAGDPGFVINVPETIEIGGEFDVMLTAPGGWVVNIIVSLSGGPTPSAVGELCLGVPFLLVVPIVMPPSGQLEFTVPVPCRPLLIDKTEWLQFIAVDPTDPGNIGVSNGVSMTGVDGPCTDACEEILGGRVWNDHDANGVADLGEPGVPGVLVEAYDAADVLVDMTLTDGDGQYQFTGIQTDALRLEFSGWPSWLTVGPAEANGGKEVQFVEGDTCEVDLALIAPVEICPEGTDACLATPCYVNGDPLLAGTAAGEDVLVRFPYDASGSGQNTYLANAVQVGATWGLAYQRHTDTLFAAAFLKRHVGFGPGGLGAIYRVDEACLGTPSPDDVSLWVDVATLPGVDLGTVSRPDLPANTDEVSYDADAFDKVGKVGLGGLAISDDETTLYAVNLNQREVLAIDIATGTLLDRFDAVAGITCTNGEARPFAVSVHRGELYVGVVCTGETDLLTGQVDAHVRRLSRGAFVDEFTFPLTYPKGKAEIDCLFLTGFFPWIDFFPTSCGIKAVFPQPILSSIEFHRDGSLALGFIDRHGHQTGYLNLALSGLQTYEGISGGDLLRATSDRGGYVLESDGSAGGVSTAGAGNGEGPGGGEYFFEDFFEVGGITAHDEVTLGGVAILPGSGEVATTAFDPINGGGDEIRTGGVRRFDVATGTITDAYKVYSLNQAGTFGKAAGLGDLALLCQALPVQVGDRVFHDLNGDGLQQPLEPGLEGVVVRLDRAGVPVESVVTDVQGRYVFSGLVPNDPDYVVLVRLNQLALAGFGATLTDAGANDLADSDGALGIVPGASVAALSGLPPGKTDFTIDFGFILLD